MRCSAKTKLGDQCKRRAGPSGFCHQHEAGAPRVDSPEAHTLTDRQRAFVHHYIACGFNGAEAARRAGYAPESARTQASQNLANPNIRAELDRMFQAQAMTSAEALGLLAMQARGDACSSRRVKRERLVATGEHDADFVVTGERDGGCDGDLVVTEEIETYDALSALKTLIVHLEPQTTRIEHTGPGGGPVMSVDPSKLSTETIRELLAAAAAEVDDG